jgi:hypothetical protein
MSAPTNGTVAGSRRARCSDWRPDRTPVWSPLDRRLPRVKVPLNLPVAHRVAESASVLPIVIRREGGETHERNIQVGAPPQSTIVRLS